MDDIQDVAQVLDQHGTNQSSGLTSKEAENRLQTNGPNDMFPKKKSKHAAIASLEEALTPQVSVLRDGQRTMVKATQIVPGDIVHLETGSIVPADGVVLSESRVLVDQSMLTGESQPVSVRKGGSIKAGCNVIDGPGDMVVTLTGANTMLGQTASLLASPRVKAKLSSSCVEALAEANVMVCNVGNDSLGKVNAVVLDIGMLTSRWKDDFKALDGVVDKIKEMKKLGIKVILATGAGEETAVMAASTIGWQFESKDESVVRAAVIGVDDLPADLSSKLSEVDALVIPRAGPQHKLDVVSKLRDSKFVVAVIGSSISDAAAVKRADVGFAAQGATAMTTSAADFVTTSQDALGSLLTSMEIVQKHAGNCIIS